MPSLYGNVSVGNTIGLYQQSSGTSQVLTNAQSLLSLLSNASTVGFSLTSANTQVQASVQPSGVTSGTYGSASFIPVITVGGDGRVTSVTVATNAGGTYSNANVTALLSGTVSIGNLTVGAGVFWSNGQPYTSGGSIYGNANVAVYLPTDATIRGINANVTAANAAIASTNANLAAFETYANATFGTNSYGNTNVAAYLSSNLVSTISTTGNIKTVANVIAPNYLFANGVNILSTIAASSTYSNANVTAYLASGTDATINAINANVTAANTKIQTISANLGSFETYANATYSTLSNAAGLYNSILGANTAIQTLSANVGAFEIFSNANTAGLYNSILGANAAIQTLNANVGSFYTYANATYQTTAGAYGNSNVAAYLPTYNGTIGTATGTVTIGGNLVTTSKLTTGNLVTSAGVFWSNGTPYSTGGGSSFTGNLAGSTLFDSVNGRILANAYPQSDPGTQPPMWQNIKNNPPVYVNGVLQAAAGTAVNGLINQNSYLMQTVGNVGLQSSYQTGTTRFTNGILNYQSIWPVTANVMQNTDRYRHSENTLEVNLNGITWASSQAQLNLTVGTQQNFLSIYGNGTLGTAGAVTGTVYLIPEGTALGSGLVANVNYVTGVTGQIQSQTTYGSTNTANVIYARGFLPQVAPASNSVAITNAVGLHTPSGWVTAPGAAGGGAITNRYAVLNEDSNSLIQTNANIVLASGSGAYLVFSDGTKMSTAAAGSTYSNANVASYLPTSTVNFGGNLSTVSGNTTIISPTNIVDMSQNTGALSIPYGSSAQRPTLPSGGSIRMNYTTGNPEWWNNANNSWNQFGNVFITNYTVGYRVLAGGGGGGAVAGGGGGAGGWLAGGTPFVPGVTYTIVVGAGGAGHTTPYTNPIQGGNGSDSTITSIGLDAIGGGGGGGYNSNNGSSGGSGGGGAQFTGSGGAGTSGQGYAGGNAVYGNLSGSGGGGAGGAGGAVNGGVGQADSITGTSIYYGGGGGGGGDTGGGTGGLGGGGTGGAGGGGTGMDGTANLGGGGGGAGGSTATSGSGGSGVVILNILTSNYSGVTTGSPVVTTNGSYTVLTYNSSGSYTA